MAGEQREDPAASPQQLLMDTEAVAVICCGRHPLPETGGGRGKGPSRNLDFPGFSSPPPLPPSTLSFPRYRRTAPPSTPAPRASRFERRRAARHVNQAAPDVQRISRYQKMLDTAAEGSFKSSMAYLSSGAGSGGGGRSSFFSAFSVAESSASSSSQLTSQGRFGNFAAPVRDFFSSVGNRARGFTPLGSDGGDEPGFFGSLSWGQVSMCHSLSYTWNPADARRWPLTPFPAFLTADDGLCNMLGGCSAFLCHSTTSILQSVPFISKKPQIALTSNPFATCASRV
ncbi:MAG: hypothetical protein BJ554DRAFT_2979 [Olpidium bornovanus]|uniref:Uncharacterized protein n=1 Tax=Olpidium bornovanus TaxID=278681 RepID=A0A8H8DG01_9FUNG|nr:MAG: hypothetical protein BJ554DRAFT_2979 [Olpidium bornovanus]